MAPVPSARAPRPRASSSSVAPVSCPSRVVTSRRLPGLPSRNAWFLLLLVHLRILHLAFAPRPVSDRPYNVGFAPPPSTPVARNVAAGASPPAGTFLPARLFDPHVQKCLFVERQAMRWAAAHRTRGDAVQLRVCRSVRLAALRAHASTPWVPLRLWKSRRRARRRAQLRAAGQNCAGETLRLAHRRDLVSQAGDNAVFCGDVPGGPDRRSWHPAGHCGVAPKPTCKEPWTPCPQQGLLSRDGSNVASTEWPLESPPHCAARRRGRVPRCSPRRLDGRARGSGRLRRRTRHRSARDPHHNPGASDLSGVPGRALASPVSLPCAAAQRCPSMGKGCRRRGVEGGRRVPGLTPGTQSSCAFEHLASWSSICRDADVLGGALPILALTYSASASPFAAILACIYGSALRWCGAHRPTVFCAATTWVLGAAAARGCADFGTGAHGAFHVPADGGVAVAVLCLFRMGWLPFGFDWKSFPFVAREFQPSQERVAELIPPLKLRLRRDPS